MVAFVYRTAKVYQKQKTDFVKFFFYGLLLLLINLSIIAIISLFFFNSVAALWLAVMVSILLQCLGFILMTKAFFPLIFPRASFKIFEIILLLLTLVAMVLYYCSAKLPFLGPSGFINWNVPLSVGIIRMLLVALPGVLSTILFSQQVKSEIKEIRKKSIIFLILIVGGFISFFSFFVIFRGSGVSESFIVLFFIFIVWILTFWAKQEEKAPIYRG